MSSKEERERLRRERLAAQQAASSSERRRLILGYVVAGLIVAAILIGLFIVLTADEEGSGPGGNISAEDAELAGVQHESGSVNDLALDTREGASLEPLAQGDLARSAEAAGCRLRLNLPDEGKTHFGPKQDPPEYGTNPATSGDHIVPGLQQADGAYREQPKEERVVHSLEHGRIAIQYSPELSEQQQLELKGLFDESPQGVLLFPNDDMPYAVAATGWTQLIGCEEYEGQTTIDALRNFRDVYRGRGPEPVPLAL